MTVAAKAPLTIRWEGSGVAQPAPSSRFLPLMRKAVAAAPGRSDLKVHLARALFEADQAGEIVDRFASEAADVDAEAELLYWVGRAAIAARKDDLALQALGAAAAKGMSHASSYLAATLVRAGRGDEALQAAVDGLSRTPVDVASLPVVARILLDRGEASRVWDLCRDLQARGARGGWFLAVMVSAAATLGLTDELRALMDPSRWFLATRLAMPGGFNRKLAAELLGHKSLARLPATKATRGSGGRIDRLQAVGGPCAQDLLARIRHAVEAYAADRQAFRDDPMIAERPASVEINSWALAVHDDGHEEWHIHPHGWISGVYYVDVPRVEADSTGCPGAIEFGPYPFGRHAKALAAHCWHLRPEPGLLLLFPSYFAHRTWPTGVSDRRICIAFDIRPSDAALD